METGGLALDKSGRIRGVIWKYCAGLFVAVCMSFVVKAQQPVISSFLPVSGNKGTVITITGTGLSVNSRVYFGSIRTAVTGASSGQITVTVPAGAPYAPITVINTNGLISVSSDYFTPTFATCETITTSTFTTPPTLSGSSASQLFSADIDLDGRPDFISFNKTSVSVYKNISTASPAVIGFSTSKYDMPTNPGTGADICNGGVVADLDGDGKPDIAVVNTTKNRIYIYHNESTGGVISFSTDPASPYITGLHSPTGITSGDFDGDGKIDLAILNTGNASGTSTGEVTFLRNTSTVGNLLFTAAGTPIGVGTAPWGIISADFNEDGKADLAISNSDVGNVQFLKNITSGTAFDFENNVFASTGPGSSPQGMGIGDFDNDGKVDLVVVAAATDKLLFVHNESGPTTLNFTTATLTPSPAASLAGRIAVGDLDGDAKPDVVVGSDGGAITFFKNTSTAGISFSPTGVERTTGGSATQPLGVCIADIDRDGKPDLSNVNFNGASVDFYMNSINQVIVYSLTPDNGVPGTEVTLKGENLTCVSDVFLGGVGVAVDHPINFVSGTEIRFKVNSSNSTGNVLLKTTGGVATGLKFTFVTKPDGLSYCNNTNDTTVIFGTGGQTGSPVLANTGGGGVTYEIVKPDARIDRNTNTGQISWTNDLPVGDYLITVNASNAAGAATPIVLKLHVVPGIPKDFAYVPDNYTTDFGTADSTVTPPDIEWSGKTGVFTILNNPYPGKITIKADGTVKWSTTVPVDTVVLQIKAENEVGPPSKSDTAYLTLRIRPLLPSNLAYVTAPALSTDTIKYQTTGSAVVKSIQWNGQVGTYNDVSSPSHPAGIKVDPNTGLISWDASVPIGSYPISVEAVNSRGSSTPATVFILVVVADKPSAPIYTPQPAVGYFSKADSSGIPVVNWHGDNSSTFEVVGALPAGITLDVTNGKFHWDNTLAVATYTVMVRAKNNGGTGASTVFTLVIKPLPPSGLAYDPIAPVPYGVAGSVLPQLPVIWNGQTGTFSIIAPSPLTDTIAIDVNTGKISWNDTTPVGTYNIKVIAHNDGGNDTADFKLVVYALDPSEYYFAPDFVHAPCGKADSSILPHIKWNGSVGTFSRVSVAPALTKGSINVTKSTGRITWSPGVSPGTYVITASAVNSTNVPVTTTFTLYIDPARPSALVYTPPSVTKNFGTPGGSASPTVLWNNVSNSGSYFLFDTGLPGQALPAGMTFDATTGIISWDATVVSGTYVIKVKAKNEIGESDPATFTLKVNPLLPTVFYYPDGGEDAIFGVADTSRLPIVNLQGGVGKYYFLSTGMPAGVDIDSLTGAIHWPDDIPFGFYSWTIRVNNGVGQLTTPFILNVMKGAPTDFYYSPAVTSNAPYGVAGSSVVPNINWHGDVGTFTILNKPAGLSITPTGVINWSAAVAGGTYNLKIKAENTTNPPDTADYKLIVQSLPPTGLVYVPDSVTAVAGTAGKSVKPNINWNGDQDSFRIVSIVPALPAGADSIITIDKDGYISWKKNIKVERYVITVEAFNSGGTSNQAIFKLIVDPGNPTIVYTPPTKGVLFNSKDSSVIPVISWNGKEGEIGSISLVNPNDYPPGLVNIDTTTGVLYFDASGITTPTSFPDIIVVVALHSRIGTATYRFVIAGIPSDLDYSTKGYTFLEGTVAKSVKPTVNWNGLPGTFRIARLVNHDNPASPVDPAAIAGITIDSVARKFSIDNPNAGIITFGSTVPAGNYDIKVIAVNELGHSDTVTLNLTIIPQADVALTGGATACAGSETTITVNLSGVAPWSFDYTDGTTSKTINNVTSTPYLLKVTPAVNTTYTVTSLSDANGTNTDLDPVTAHIDVAVYTLPPALINDGQPLAACVGATVALTANTGTGYTYLWSTGATTDNITATTNGDYTVTVTDGNHCSAVSPVVKVKVGTIPTAGITPPATTLICEGSSLNITATGGNTYTWYRNSVVIPGATTATYGAIAEGSYTVDAVSAEGCTTKAVGVVTLTFAKKPTANFSFDAYCKDADLGLINSSDEGGEATNYLWVFDADNSTTIKEPSFAYATSGAKTIQLTATSKVCPDLSSTKKVDVTVEEPAPSQRYEAMNAIIGRTATLKSKATGTGYTWTPAAGLSDASNAMPTLKVDHQQEYTVKITTDAGCVTVDTQLVRIFKGAEIFVPKAFSPNGDGMNDKLYPIPVGVPQLTYFRVFNRWGVLMYETKEAGTPNNGIGWDGTYKGKLQPLDSYVWVAEGVDIDGKPVKLSGNTVLIR